MLTLNLPFPVSVNAMYANKGKRRIKSKRYFEWRIEALKCLDSVRLNTLIDYPIMLQIAFIAPDRRKRDLDNHAKAIQDVLTGNIIEDDSQIKLLCMWWDQLSPSKAYAGAQVIISPLHSPDGQSFLESLQNARAAA